MRNAQVVAVTRGASQSGYSRPHKEVRECPFIARSPDIPQRASLSQAVIHYA